MTGLPQGQPHQAPDLLVPLCTAMGTDPLSEPCTLPLPRQKEWISPLILLAVSLQRQQCPPCLAHCDIPSFSDALALAARASRHRKLLALTCDQMIKD